MKNYPKIEVQDGIILWDKSAYYPEKTAIGTNNKFAFGNHAYFLQKDDELEIGYKFWIRKNICYSKSKIEEIQLIHQYLYQHNWTNNAFDLFPFIYNENLHYGLIVEHAFYSAGGRTYFDKDDFRKFCQRTKSLKKREFKNERELGIGWEDKYPEKTFYVGDNNLMKTKYGKTILFDIDPRWSMNR
ncbi:hypothetical protein [Saprospira grandis]|uniref:Uncharacterized protein n=1 Tax=Saprospira grandis (strain Lewin) TaxID=984262 RepID=H6L1Z8_SAPGL|nr:hypothetical protein [Saprospira grandis]AFC23535.1 hypothetical protein SGRA_0797 [Saprospira grandis str. Lewin]